MNSWDLDRKAQLFVEIMVDKWKSWTWDCTKMGAHSLAENANEVYIIGHICQAMP